MPISTNTNLQSTRGQQAVIFYPFKYHFGASVTNYPLDTIRIDGTSSVLAINVQDSKESPSGSFTITMAPDRDWRARIRPGDWLLIYASQFEVGAFSSPQSTNGLKCLGNIDRITRQRQIGKDGKSRMVYLISGRNFGKIFEKTQFYFNPYIPSELTTLLVVEQTGFLKLVGTPREFLTAYFNIYFGSLTYAQKLLANSKSTTNPTLNLNIIKELRQCQIPPAIYKVFGLYGNKQNLAQLINLKIGGVKGTINGLEPDGYSISINPKTAVDGNLWTVFKAVSNPLINELYTCMRYNEQTQTVQPTLVLRKIPFGKDIYANLPSITVQDSMVVAEDLGYDDHSRYNWFNFEFDSLPGLYKGLMAVSQGRWDGVNPYSIGGNYPLFPYADAASIQRYGFCSLGTQSSTFLAINPNTPSKNPEQSQNIILAESWMRQLIDWHSNWIRCLSGTMVLKGFQADTTMVPTPPSAFQSSYVSNASTPATINVPNTTLNSVIGIDTNLNPTSSNYSKSIETDTYTIGDNIYLSDRSQLFHLEGYSLNWNTPGEIDITFTLVRGVYMKTQNSHTFQFFDQLIHPNDPVTDLEQKDESVSTTYNRSDSDDGGSGSDNGGNQGGGTFESGSFGNGGNIV